MALLALSADLLAELDAIEAAVPGARAEFIGGQYVVNRPVNLHAHSIMEIGGLLRAEYLEEDERVLPEVRVSTPDALIIPDLVVVKKELLDASGPIPVDELLLAVEVLSPSTAHTDRNIKRRIFQAAQVDYWIAEQAHEATIADKYGYGGGRFNN